MSIKLPQDTAAAYELVNEDQLYPKCAFGAWGEIDFEKLTIEHADSLVAAGFPHLKPRAKKASTTASSSTGTTAAIPTVSTTT